MLPLYDLDRPSEWRRQLYSIRLMPDGVYRIVKFDGWFNVIKVNYVWRKGAHSWNCTCERAAKSNTCRHRFLREFFDKENKTGTGWFFDYDTREWERPLGDPIRRYEQLKRQMKERSNG